MCSVSIVMPLYNTEQYVAEAIRSVLAQTYPDFELLIIDDGSTDRSGQIAGSFHDPRIRLVWQQNQGLSGARNTGIKLARGQFIALLDADDRWSPDKLERHVRHLRESPDVGVSYSQSNMMDEKGVSLNLKQAPKLSGVTSKDILCRNPVGNGSAAVIRTETLEAIRFADERGKTCYFDESLRQSEDIECWLRIATTTPWRFAGIGIPLTWYRINSAGLSADLDAQYDAWLSVLRKTGGLAPGLVRRYGSLARAFQLRYLARRAVQSRQADAALSLLFRALAADLRLMACSPVRTAITLGCAVLLRVLSPDQYENLESACRSWAARQSARRSMARRVRQHA